jgi:hypothetical protein
VLDNNSQVKLKVQSIFEKEKQKIKNVEKTAKPEVLK